MVIAETVGVGLTIIVKLCELPLQPLATGVAVTVEITATLPLFNAVNAGISPVPEATRFMLLLLFVQL